MTMNLVKIKALVANQYAMDPKKRHVLIVHNMPQGMMAGIWEAWKQKFGHAPIIISADPGSLAIFEIEPKP